MKIRNLILIGLLSSLVFAIALLPASLLWGAVSGSLGGLPMQVERVGGTVWDGYAVGRVRTPVWQGPVVVRWDLKGYRLLLGELAVGLDVEGNQFRLGGSGHMGLWGKGVKHLNGDVQGAMLDQSLRQFGISVAGVLTVDNVSINLSGDTITTAEGQIRWTGGGVTAPGRGSRNPIDYPPVLGQVHEEEGGLLLSVTETRGNQALGELALMPEKGIYGVKALQRILSLAGMSPGGDDNKVLLNLQQPLPF